MTGEVETHDPPLTRELGYLPVPHVPGGPQRGPQDQDRSVFSPVRAVLQGVRWCLAHSPDPLIWRRPPWGRGRRRRRERVRASDRDRRRSRKNRASPEVIPPW
ncbi:hypothetical protein BN2537_4041 [Streptomyces venezuelae]|nr:hypothetical protein BN2537_4041 [Streptomyces venezuelae]